MKNKYDVVIIGFGKAGKTLAVKLSKANKKVALIEKDKNMYGGTCINVGCIPSKRLITDSINISNKEFSSKEEYYKNSIDEKNKLTLALRKANYDKLIQAGVEIIDGNATFIDEHNISVTTNETTLYIEADKFVINTGATQIIPKIQGLNESKKVYLSDTLMNLSTLPKTLTIIGGGYIGVEFASMYANFGSDVTIIQDNPIFLPREDEDIALEIKSSLEKKGIKIVTGATITKINDGTVFFNINEESNKIDSDAILLATGRRPNTDDLGCLNAGISLNEKGAVETDEHLRTSVNHIWAAGDVCGKLQFTYISLDDSRIILDDMNGKGDRTINNRGSFSYSVFIDPPFSRVGMNEKEAKASQVEYRVVKLLTNAIPKAKVMRKTEGLLKALVSADGSILGAEFFCEESHEMINLIKLAIDYNIKAESLRDFIFTHPTMSESLNDLFSM